MDRTREMEDGCGRSQVNLVNLINLMKFRAVLVCPAHRGGHARASLYLIRHRYGLEGCRTAQTYVVGLRRPLGQQFCHR